MRKEAMIGMMRSTFLSCVFFALPAVEVPIEASYIWNHRSAGQEAPLLLCSYLNQGRNALLFDANPFTLHRGAAVAYEVQSQNPSQASERIALMSDDLNLLDREEKPIVDAWFERDDLILLPGEGYARQVAFSQTWLDGLDGRAFSFRAMVPTMVRFAEPGQWEAAAKGAELRFSEEKQLFSHKTTTVPALADSVASGQEPWPVSEHGLGMQIHLLAQDESYLRVLHVIGNSSQQTMYVEQNDMRQAALRWTLAVEDEDERVLVVDEANAYPAPPRQAIALFPGELLTWVNSLPLRHVQQRGKAHVAAQVDVPYVVGQPTADPHRALLRAELEVEIVDNKAR